MADFSKKTKKKSFFSKKTVNPLRKKFQFFLKNNFFFHKHCKNSKIVSEYDYIPQKFLKCVYKDVVD
jgi:hypothetical protein